MVSNHFATRLTEANSYSPSVCYPNKDTNIKGVDHALINPANCPLAPIGDASTNPLCSCIALLGVLGLGAANARGQASPSSGSGVSRTAKAVTYRRGGVAKVSLRGTNLMPGGSGEAQVENKGNRVEIEVNVHGHGCGD